MNVTTVCSVPMLSVSGLCAETHGKNILTGLDLEVRAGEVHAIMGPNGSGKSTLSKVIAGHPDYHVTAGTISYSLNGEDQMDLLSLTPDQRARLGVFLAFQYPVEIPGVTNLEFLRAAYNARRRDLGEEPLDPIDFADILAERAQFLGFDGDYAGRQVNLGMSGGEKKRNEILQMAVLNPRLAVLDETDSGLDVDSLRIVASGVNRLRNGQNGIILITHYSRILKWIEPDFVHVLMDGRIVRSGDKTMADEVEAEGYDQRWAGRSSGAESHMS